MLGYEGQDVRIQSSKALFMREKILSCHHLEKNGRGAHIRQQNTSFLLGFNFGIFF